MNKLQFRLEGHEYIALNNLLKVLTLVQSGGEANIRITGGEAEVNGTVDYRKRKKIRVGDVVVFAGSEVTVIA